MDSTTIPVFDFNTPWVALIQLALFYLLPRLVGLVTDKISKSIVKITLLAALALLASFLTWLLDVAVADTWATLDWSEAITILVNAAITFALANGVFKGVIVPLGQAAKDAENRNIQIIDRPEGRYTETAP